jgi:hypothetical protein
MGFGGGIDAGAPLVDTLRRSTGLTGYTFYRWLYGRMSWYDFSVNLRRLLRN